MCNPAEFMTVVLIAAFVAAAVNTYRLQQNFSKTLKDRYPDIWNRMGTEGIAKWDDNPKESAIGWYLLFGDYRILNDEVIDQIGNKARRSTWLASGIGLAAFALSQAPTYRSIFACVPW